LFLQYLKLCTVKMNSNVEVSFQPFAILTPRLIIVPTPTAVTLSSYRALYSDLHANVAFCEMAFGHHFPARTWSDAETRNVIQTRDIERCWGRRGLGDFAVGLRESASHLSHPNDIELAKIKGSDYERLVGVHNPRLANVQWVGYAGVRDATTTSLPSRESEDPALPPWLEMIEVRYGLSPHFWGQGIAMEAAKAIMQWSVEERGVKRFIAETEKENNRSAKLLQNLGFTPSGTDYWKEPSEVEWECVKW
jgi:RimJ/RimL family protein N-acetyltransferase